MKSDGGYGPLVGSGFILDAAGERVRWTHGAGPYAYSDDGRRYIDFILGVGPVIIGHGCPEFNDLVGEYSRGGLNLPSYMELHYRYAIELMEGNRGEHVVVLFAKTASEAVVFALRLAALEKKKLGVIRCGYLGQSDVAMGRSIKWHEPLHSRYRSEVRLDFGCRGIGDLEPVYDWTDLNLDTLAQIIDRHGNGIGAMAVDAQQFALSDEADVPEVLRMCRDAGICFIMDETKTAGRDGARGYFDQYLQEIDYTILGKAVGNGAPLAVLTGRLDRSDLYKVAKIGGTHSKEAFGAAAGLAKIELMAKTDGYSKVAENVRGVVSCFNRGFSDSPLASRVSARSYYRDTLFELEFSRDATGDQDFRDAVKRSLQVNGLLVLEGHCSFVCRDHSLIDFVELEEAVRRAAMSFES